MASFEFRSVSNSSFGSRHLRFAYIFDSLEVLNDISNRNHEDGQGLGLHVPLGLGQGLILEALVLSPVHLAKLGSVSLVRKGQPLAELSVETPALCLEIRRCRRQAAYFGRRFSYGRRGASGQKRRKRSANPALPQLLGEAYLFYYYEQKRAAAKALAAAARSKEVGRIGQEVDQLRPTMETLRQEVAKIRAAELAEEAERVRKLVVARREMPVPRPVARAPTDAEALRQEITRLRRLLVARRGRVSKAYKKESD